MNVTIETNKFDSNSCLFSSSWFNLHAIYSAKKDELYSDGGIQIVRLKAYEIDLVSMAIVSWISEGMVIKVELKLWLF